MRDVRSLAIALGLLLGLSGGEARALDFSFTGTFATDDEVQLFGFTVGALSEVTLFTYGYAGGTQTDGNVVPEGGFDPILALFDAAGTFLSGNDDGNEFDPDSCDTPASPVTFESFDSCIQVDLAPGGYLVAVTQFDNEANGDLADGFFQQGLPSFTADFGCSNGQFCDVDGENRTNAWAFDVLGVDAATVPEAGRAALVGAAAAGLALRRRG